MKGWTRRLIRTYAQQSNGEVIERWFDGIRRNQLSIYRIPHNDLWHLSYHPAGRFIGRFQLRRDALACAEAIHSLAETWPEWGQVRLPAEVIADLRRLRDQHYAVERLLYSEWLKRRRAECDHLSSGQPASPNIS